MKFLLSEKQICENVGPPGRYGYRWGDYVIARTIGKNPSIGWMMVRKARILHAFDEASQTWRPWDWWLICLDADGKRHQFRAAKVIRHSYRRSAKWLEQNGHPAEGEQHGRVGQMVSIKA